MKSPYLQSYRVLLDLLRTLSLVRVWRRHTEIQCQLRPGLDLIRAELANQLEQCPCAECVSITLWRYSKQLHQLGRICGGAKTWVAIQDEACEGVVDGVVGHVLRGQSAIVWGVAGACVLRLARGRYCGREARRGI